MQLSSINRTLTVALAACFTLFLARSGLPAPTVTGISLESTSTGVYDKMEVTFAVSTVANNLYWPYDPSPAANTPEHPSAVPAGVGVSVDGLFLPPLETDWSKAVVQPAFYVQQFQELNGVPYPSGDACWKIRLAPTALGIWRFKIRARDSSGVVESAEQSFTSVTGPNLGFVRVSPTDCRYFETSNGRYLSLCGLNAASPVTEARYALMQANGINLLRPWWNGSQGPVLFGLSGQGGVPDWNYITNNSWSSEPPITGAVTRTGELFSGVMLADGDTTLRTTAYVKPNTTYRFSAWVKAVGLSVSSGGGVFLSASPCTRSDQDLTTRITGECDWTQLTGSLTTIANQTSIDYLKLNLKGRTAGTVYYTDFSLAEDLGSGRYGGELVRTPSFNKHAYMSGLSAYEADKQVELAGGHGIYLKIVLEEKDDVCFGNIQTDGSAGNYAYHDSRLYTNVRANQTHASRTYQSYLWRYVIARYGYATCIHSFEMFNEDDPFDSTHYAAAESLASYFKDNDPNQHLCTTSNWHSYPSAEFWGNSAYGNVGYSDWHQYIGNQTGSGLQYRYGWGFSNTTGTTNSDLDGVNTYIDRTVYLSAPCSLKIHGAGNANGLTMNPIPIIPNHTYTLAWKVRGVGLTAQGSNAGSQAWIKGPTLMFVYKTGWWSVEIDRIIPDLGGNMGTYDWKSKSYTFTAPSNAHYINLQPTIQWAVGDCWFDDITLHDDTSNDYVAVPNPSFDDAYRASERDSRLDYDTAIVNYSMGAQVGNSATRSKMAPCIRGELGISGDNTYGNPYKTMVYVGENQQLVDDTDGIWYEKLVWGQVNQFGIVDMYWWDANIARYGLLEYVKAYQAFMSGIPLSNGHYTALGATSTNKDLRLLGQKDLTNNRAHLWIDNAPYTWKAVVDHNYSPEPWNSLATYAKDSTCGSGSTTHIYKSLRDNNKDHAVSDTAWWQDTGAFNPANNPPLPPSVSGSVTVPGLKDGLYTVEWWDTTTGTVTRTEIIQSSSGSLSLAISDLVSDVACKIVPAADKITERLISSSSTVIPGETVTFTHEYTNIGGSDSRNLVLTDTVPDKMNYVAGSAEASGGAYDPTTKKVTWSVPLIKAGETGSRTFRATVK